jgi:hypothetical protein
VAIKPIGVTYEDGKEVKSLGVSNAYLVPNLGDVRRLIHASTADIVATDTKYDKSSKNLSTPEWPENFNVQVSNSVPVREHLKIVVSSRSKSRDQMFELLSNQYNNTSSIRYHSVLGQQLTNFSPIPSLTELLKKWYVANKTPIPADIDVSIIGTDNGSIISTTNMQSAYKYYFQSVSIRGGRDGKNVSHGFERFCMSRTMANNLNLLQDFMNMSDQYGTRTVLIRESSYLSHEEMRVLIANKFRIIVPTTLYGKCTNDSLPGLYGKYEAKMILFEYIVFSDDQVKPKVVNNLLTMGPYYDEALLTVGRTKRGFARIYLDERLKSYDASLGFLPSATADTMQIIVATGVKTTYGITQLLKRATLATSCRNNFVRSRKPFFYDRYFQ